MKRLNLTLDKRVISLKFQHEFQILRFSQNLSSRYPLTVIFVFILIYEIIFSVREGFKKKIKKNYGKFHTRGGGGGSAGVIFHKQFFFIFFAPNGLKIIFRH